MKGFTMSQAKSATTISTSHTPTIYQKLPDQTIRLLSLHPGSGGDLLEADFTLLFLPNPPNQDVQTYEALSYTWGEPIFSQSILCDMFTIPITQNLFEALVHLRDEDTVRTIWVDAICINQKDNLEKAIQIPLMRSIYTQAQHVIIWIGVEDESTKLAVGLIRTAATCTRKEIAAHRLAHEEAETENSGLRRIDREPWTEEELKQWGLPSDRGIDYKAFNHFCDREWFSRVWTKQEAIFAISATMFIGEEHLDWLHFILAMQFFVLKRLSPTKLAKELILTCMASRAWSASSTPLFYNLEFLLPSTRNLKASEPRDNIYGILGLAKKDWYGRGILIDYEKPVKELFTQTTRYLISRSYDVGFSLNVLSFVGHPWPQFKSLDGPEELPGV